MNSPRYLSFTLHANGIDDKIIVAGTVMTKPEKYQLYDTSPCQLSLPTSTPETPTASVPTTEQPLAYSSNDQRTSNLSNETVATAPIHLSKIINPPPPPFCDLNEAPPTASGEQRPRSDSDIAREIQAQINGENDLPPPYSAIEKTVTKQTRERSDSELARELQAKLNSGQDI